MNSNIRKGLRDKYGSVRERNIGLWGNEKISFHFSFCCWLRGCWRRSAVGDAGLTDWRRQEGLGVCRVRAQEIAASQGRWRKKRWPNVDCGAIPCWSYDLLWIYQQRNPDTPRQNKYFSLTRIFRNKRGFISPSVCPALNFHSVIPVLLHFLVALLLQGLPSKSLPSSGARLLRLKARLWNTRPDHRLSSFAISLSCQIYFVYCSFTPAR